MRTNNAETQDEGRGLTERREKPLELRQKPQSFSHRAVGQPWTRSRASGQERFQMAHRMRPVAPFWEAEALGKVGRGGEGRGSCPSPSGDPTR